MQNIVNLSNDVNGFGGQIDTEDLIGAAVGAGAIEADDLVDLWPRMPHI